MRAQSCDLPASSIPNHFISTMSQAATASSAGWPPAVGIIGVGGELNWLKPVRPGDELRVEIEILETRISRSRPDQGVVRIRLTTVNQHGDPVQTFVPTLFVERRHSAE